ncbi:MAG TPA: VOC family protein, partial [Gammaproteobacteria bacterium]|nr:VOC family protein [Gammaproteobacteria bacterium]
MIEKPDRYRNAVVPHIYVSRAADAIAFYERAFGAVELFRIAAPVGKILHAEISIADSLVMLGDPDEKLYADPRALGRCTTSLHILLEDNDALFRRATTAGAEPIQPPTDMFYGANSASVRDPFGHVWVLLSWKEDLPPAEMERRGNALLNHQRRYGYEAHMRLREQLPEAAVVILIRVSHDRGGKGPMRLEPRVAPPQEAVHVV